ncbi:MAG: phosphoenolpyruvate--protein phosphotransferase [Thiogranum sp.]|jgi:phosphotransferase system enzyme I (PtsI)|nr:phosphoenolpyruvate--protein phosphotransferase [Thiogranum sp.]
MSVAIPGTGISHGIAIGPIHRLIDGEIEISEAAIPEELIENEVARFRRAVRVARQQLKVIRDSIPEITRADITDFIDTHLLMLEDSMLTATPVELIRERQCNAEWALKSQRDALAAVFDEMDDAYLRTRMDDVDHVVSRIQRILANEGADTQPQDSEKLRGAIVVAHDLTPAETALLHHQGIAGFVTESGGPLSHTAILARSLGLPSLVGTHFTPYQVRDGELAILDAVKGRLLTEIDADTLKKYRRRQREEIKRQSKLKRLKNDPATSADGVHVELLANVELREDVLAARRAGADGIGLYRTEFLFMNRSDIPDEEEQLQQYLSVLKALKGLPVTIRTLDLGADKNCGGEQRSDHVAPNPALGLRAIRLCLKHADLFRPQLRAILRASAKGPVRMMIPMLSSSSELDAVLALIDDVKQELQRQRLAFDLNTPIGGMIEVPAAALSASLFARRLDFLSIGTNDLIQYTLAIDRVDDEVTYLYDPLHPAVLRLIKMVIEAGRTYQIPVSMCGEMAGDTRYTRLLLGMGLSDFSVHPTALLEVKDAITRCEVARYKPLVTDILDSDDPVKIGGLLKTLNQM